MTSLWRHSRLTYYNLGHYLLTHCMALLPGEHGKFRVVICFSVGDILGFKLGAVSPPPPNWTWVKVGLSLYAYTGCFIKMYPLRKIAYNSYSFDERSLGVPSLERQWNVVSYMWKSNPPMSYWQSFPTVKFDLNNMRLQLCWTLISSGNR